MAKLKTSYFCQNCGYQSPKWLGKCPACSEWNTFAEEILQKEEPSKTPWKQSSTSLQIANKPKIISKIDYQQQSRFITTDSELNRVLGGGIVAGSLVLIGGEPGIGKSTLMLQIAMNCKGLKVLYVSGEESDQQIKMRAERLENSLADSQCFVFLLLAALFFIEPHLS